MLRLAFLLFVLPAALWANPTVWQNEFPKTDFSKRTIDSWGEILSGGPPRDGIPALVDPEVIGVEQAELPPREPVITVELDGETPRAYPIRYLIWHEIANDRIGDVPVAVTFCPLCNSALTFDRRHGGQVLTFGVSGKLRHSDMVMYDRETESWWQQALGEGIVGQYAGDELTQVPSWMEAWGAFVDRNPQGDVMAEPAHNRRYGENPYVNYDDRARPYPFFTGEDPPHGIPALARVVRVGDRAWPMSRLAQGETLTEAGVSIEWAHDQASALGAQRMGEADTVAAIRVQDDTGADLPHDVMFAFAFHAFYPDGAWMLE